MTLSSWADDEMLLLYDGELMISHRLNFNQLSKKWSDNNIQFKFNIFDITSKNITNLLLKISS